MEQPITNPSVAGGQAGPRLKVVGVGGAGLHAVEHLSRNRADAASLAVVHTDARLLGQSPIEDRLLLGSHLTRGMKAGDPDVGRAIAEGEAERIGEFCAGLDLVLILSGLGGNTGSGVAPVLARVARESGALVLAIVTLPFEFEGRRRTVQAQAALRLLRTAADAVIVLPNQKVAGLIEENASLTEALGKANELLADGVRGLCRLVTHEGLIKADFSDVCEAVRGRHAESCLAAAEAAGEGRVRAVVQRLLESPFLEGGAALAGADALLVSIAGGPGLSLKEIHQLMDQINRLCEKAQVIMGAEVDPALEDRLLVTLVGARRVEPDGTADQPGEVDERIDEAASALVSEFPTGAEEPGRRPPAGSTAPRSPRFAPPPPNLNEEETRRLLDHQRRKSGRRRGRSNNADQGLLNLEVISKGRFDRSEPTRHRGEDLDTPTYIRRGIVLN
ncbi:MAG: hypothetical protein H7A45_03095 [Verrucomicrobiales bacterium]|nr:hypothetical protein [Verrucomicrobiales bacterium]